MKFNDIWKQLLLWGVIAIALIFLFNAFRPSPPAAKKLSYSTFLSKVESGNVGSVTFEKNNISGVLTSGQKFKTYSPDNVHTGLVAKLVKNNVEVNAEPPKQPSLLMRILLSWGPWILLIAVWIFLMRHLMQGAGGGRGAMSFGKSKARLMTEEQIKVTFADVAGVEEAKDEVSELVDFLRDPGKFQRLGGRIPKGVLMVGAPGTGKTLLARAIAGEAKVPFFSISGSDFVEMFVGVGASRVRDMFEQAKKHAPCIIFIDEIDAVGRHRGAGLGGGHDEREQTLNQLLVEMDGFEGTEGVIVMAATNRPDVLDPALLRPGRFDRQVVVPLPDVRGREQILKVHMRKLPLADDVQPMIIARGTPGFSGADLANLTNEAALIAARGNRRAVSMEEFERAKDKIMMGAERRSMAMSEEEKRRTAFHEAGHAIVGLSVPEHDPVYKVTIIPRGRALGVTMFLPEEDRYSASKQRLNSQLASLFGGRLAEEIVFGGDNVTTGASNDIERATEIARNMVTKWGLSEKLGPLSYTEEDDEVFLGRQVTRHKQVSDETAHTIDEEVRTVIDTAYTRARNILTDQRDKLDTMAEALIRYETIDAGQIADIMAGRKPREPKDWTDPGGPGDEVPDTAAKGKDGGHEKGGKIGDPANQH